VITLIRIFKDQEIQGHGSSDPPAKSYFKAMDRPTIFLSSTVHDFADLRGALKDYLEQRGCRVLASEFTDFTRPLDKHSYEACLDTIQQADLFVLFIGRRVGGWFDEGKKISITRAEYEHASGEGGQDPPALFCSI
jgi:hypothetical protein